MLKSGRHGRRVLGRGQGFMKKYIGLFVLLGAVLLTGCREKEGIPLTSSAVSLEDGEPSDVLENVELPGEEIPEYDVELPENLSSFTIAIWGECYQLPMEFQEFERMGWNYQGDQEKSIEAETYLQGEVFEKDGNRLTVDLMNPRTTAQNLSECYIAGIQIDTAAPEGAGIYASLPGDVILQKSDIQEAEAVYGEPVDRFEGESEILLTYEFGMYRSVQLGFEKETGVFRRMDMKNFSNLETVDLTGISSSPTEEVKAYEAPEQLSEVLEDFTAEYGGQLYRLPAPVSAFEKNGWTINAAESDYAVMNGRYGNVTLERDGAKLYAVVNNHGSEAAFISNCFVTTLYGDMDTTKVPVVIAGGIRLGMPEAEFLALTEGSRWEKEVDEENQLMIYTCYLNDSQVDYTEVIMDSALHLIRGIKIVNNEDTELTDETAAGDAV